MELVFPEIQLAKMSEEFGLLVRRHKLRSIFEPLRKRGQRREKTELTTTHVSPDMGGCRLCERMSDISPQDLADAIVRDAVHRYIESRRGRIDAFVDRHFTLAGSAALHRRALGWDLLRAPANLFLAGPALAVKLAAWAARRAGMERAAAWLAGRRLLLETEVAREIEWLVATGLLEIPCRRRDRVAYRDAIAETILADERAASLLVAPPGADPDFRRRLAAAVETYLGSRTATAEIATGFVAASFGALAVKQATPGLVTLSSALAAMIAQQMAIAAFPLGASLGGLWYIQPVSGRRRSGTARLHDCRPVPRRRHVGRLFRRRHGSRAAPARPASAKARAAFADPGDRFVRTASSKSDRARPLCRPPC